MYRFLGYLLVLFPSLAFAMPTNWQMHFQEAASVAMERFVSFHHLLLIIITSVVIFVFVLLTYTCVRFYHKNNPVPNKFTHNVGMEIFWTVIPCILLIIIAIPSFKLLYYVDSVGPRDMTIKVVGRQWFWQYEYPEEKIAFDSYMIPDNQLKPGEIRLLSVDNSLVLPVDTDIRIMVTGGDVLHSFAMPAFGIKIDAVPGRINETWVRITKTGNYYGQCSELCGIGHGFMPIAIKAVSKEDYKTWTEAAKVKFPSA